MDIVFNSVGIYELLFKKVEGIKNTITVWNLIHVGFSEKDIASPKYNPTCYWKSWIWLIFNSPKSF